LVLNKECVRDGEGVRGEKGEEVTGMEEETLRKDRVRGRLSTKLFLKFK